MFILEFRFLSENAKHISKLIMYLENKLEIISIINSDYYICYRLKTSVNPKILAELKENKHIYFLTHYIN